jgi:hypothetical protein
MCAVTGVIIKLIRRRQAHGVSTAPAAVADAASQLIAVVLLIMYACAKSLT